MIKKMTASMMPTHGNAVVIQVENGMVSGVYATNPEMDVEILDLDTTDGDAEVDLKRRRQEIEERIEKGELHSLY